MSLRAQADLDLATTLEASVDFGEAITLTDPAGLTAVLFGQTGRIGETIDPDTGLGVSASITHCVFRLASLTAAGFTDIPVGIADPALDPWLAEFSGTSRPTQKYKVKESRPDETLGVVKLFLEFWKDAP